MRFIPTRVGNTKLPFSGLRAFPVHPHARGEHGGSHGGAACCRGSSPRAWGTLFAAIASESMRPVHPHARGEHTAPGSGATAPSGSSPRAWGTPDPFISRGLPFRFIPTRVGNTADQSTSKLPFSVHPHARGEHTTRQITHYCFDGSSPRAWGTPVFSGGARDGVRFIPTRVGNT